MASHRSSCCSSRQIRRRSGPQPPQPLGGHDSMVGDTRPDCRLLGGCVLSGLPGWGRPYPQAARLEAEAGSFEVAAWGFAADASFLLELAAAGGCCGVGARRVGTRVPAPLAVELGLWDGAAVGGEFPDPVVDLGEPVGEVSDVEGLGGMVVKPVEAVLLGGPGEGQLLCVLGGGEGVAGGGELPERLLLGLAGLLQAPVGPSGQLIVRSAEHT